MSGEGRARRDIPRVNYAEPGDNPDESALEPSVEGGDSSATSETSFVSIEDQDSFASAGARTTVVASVGDSIGEPLLGSSPRGGSQS